MRQVQCISMDHFKAIMDPIITHDEFPYNLSTRVMKDLSKVMFDMENCSVDQSFGNLPCGYKMIHGTHFIWGWKANTQDAPFLFVNAGGDWEEPIVFVLYWDGKRVRGYIPKDGNTWDLKYKTAHGSQMEREEWPEDQDIPTPNPRIADEELIIEYIINRIQFKP